MKKVIKKAFVTKLAMAQSGNTITLQTSAADVASVTKLLNQEVEVTLVGAQQDLPFGKDLE